jgi:hypothetical protein
MRIRMSLSGWRNTLWENGILAVHWRTHHRFQRGAELMTGVRMRAVIWRLILACAPLLVATASVATENDFQLWPAGRIHHAINESWSISFTARGRFDENADHSKDYLLRPYVSWTIVDDVPFIDSLTVMAGYDYLHSFDGRDEHRAWQSAHHAIEHERFRVVHRIRMDERFIEGVDPTIARFRYRLSASYPFGKSEWYGLASNEVFVNLNEGREGPHDGFEQNRLNLGLGRHLFGRLRVEGGYSFQYVYEKAKPDVVQHVVFLEFSLSTGNRKGNEFISAPKSDSVREAEDAAEKQ